jgi:hypothetical protein
VGRGSRSAPSAPRSDLRLMWENVLCVSDRRALRSAPCSRTWLPNCLLHPTPFDAAGVSHDLNRVDLSPDGSLLLSKPGTRSFTKRPWVTRSALFAKLADSSRKTRTTSRSIAMTRWEPDNETFVYSSFWSLVSLAPGRVERNCSRGCRRQRMRRLRQSLIGFP